MPTPVDDQGAGWRLRAARAELGLTEDDLAHQMRRWAELHSEPRPDITADTIVDWEGGIRRIDLGSLRLLSLVLQLPDFERPGFGELPQVDVWSLFRPARQARPEDEAGRRAFLGYVAALGEPNALDPERLEATLVALCRVDLRLVENLSYVARQLPGQRGRVPHQALRQRAHAYLQAMEAVLDTPMPGRSRRDLESAAAEAATLAGSLSTGLGDLDGAGVYFQLATRLASDAGDTETHALALMLTSRLYSSVCLIGRNEDPPRARELLEAAERLARPGVSPPVRTWVLQRLGEERAGIGDELGASRMFDEAERLVGISTPADGLCMGRDETLHVGYCGNAARVAGHPAQAIAMLETALAGLDHQSHLGTRTLMIADLAGAYAEQGEIDHACGLLGRSLTMAREAGLAGAVPRIRGVRTRHLRRHGAEPAVRELDEQLLPVS